MIIYLNGTSSSGKSSIAEELQDLIAKPFFYFSIDTLLYTLPKKALQSIQSETKIDIGYEINWESVFKGYFDCIAALSNSSNYVICDCPVYLEMQKILFEEALDPIKNKFFVGLDCNLEDLKKRELARGDRRVGLAEAQLKTIHSFIDYDLMINTSQNSAKDLAKKIKQEISNKN